MRQMNLQFGKKQNASDKDLLLRQFMRQVEALMQYFEARQSTRVSRKTQALYNWADAIKFYRKTGYPVTVNDYVDFVKETWDIDINGKHFDKRRFNIFVTYLLIKHGIRLPDDLPTCPFCQKYKAWIVLGDVFTLQDVYDYLKGHNAFDDKEAFLSLFAACLHKQCKQTYCIRKAQQSIKEKYGVDNISQLDEIKQKKKEKFLQQRDHIRLVNRIKRLCLGQLSRYAMSDLTRHVYQSAVKLLKTQYKHYYNEVEIPDFIKELEHTLPTDKKKFMSPTDAYLLHVLLLNRIKEKLAYKDTQIEVLDTLETPEDLLRIVSGTDTGCRVKCRCKEHNLDFSYYVYNFVSLLKDIVLDDKPLHAVFKCPICHASKSSLEVHIADVLHNMLDLDKVKLIRNSKQYLDGQLELDIVIADKQTNQLILGIEIDGLFWHSSQAVAAQSSSFEEFSQKLSTLEKKHKKKYTLIYERQLPVINLLAIAINTHVAEIYRGEQYLNHIIHKLFAKRVLKQDVVSTFEVYHARDLKVEVLDDTHKVNAMYDEWHAHGPINIKSEITLALATKDGEIVALMSVVSRKARHTFIAHKEDEFVHTPFEIVRYVVKPYVHIKGGFSKLLHNTRKCMPGQTKFVFYYDLAFGGQINFPGATITDVNPLTYKLVIVPKHYGKKALQEYRILHRFRIRELMRQEGFNGTQTEWFWQHRDKYAKLFRPGSVKLVF